MTLSAEEPLTEQTAVRAGAKPWWLWPSLIVVLPVAAVVLLAWAVLAALVLAAVWITWCPRGRYALVVYSDSPIWRAYFETHVLPELDGRAAVLNWSRRNAWTLSLATLVFRVFGGEREFNPLAIVFMPFRRPEPFRFYAAFRDFKRGRPAEVDAVRAAFLNTLDRASRRRHVHH